jgi:hypothetical protein
VEFLRKGKPELADLLSNRCSELRNEKWGSREATEVVEKMAQIADAAIAANKAGQRMHAKVAEFRKLYEINKSLIDGEADALVATPGSKPRPKLRRKTDRGSRITGSRADETSISAALKRLCTIMKRMSFLSMVLAVALASPTRAADDAKPRSRPPESPLDAKAAPLQIAFVSYANPQQVARDSEGVTKYLQRYLGVPVKGFVTLDYGSAIEALRNQKADLAFVDPLAFMMAHEQMGARPLLLEIYSGGKPTYHSCIRAQGQRLKQPRTCAAKASPSPIRWTCLVISCRAMSSFARACSPPDASKANSSSKFISQAATSKPCAPCSTDSPMPPESASMQSTCCAAKNASRSWP